MRVRLASTLRRLDKVESVLVAEDGSARGGVMKVPAILTLDAWEKVAMPMLAKLAASAAEDIERRQADEPRFVHPMPVSPTAVMEPPMFGVLEPATGG